MTVDLIISFDQSRMGELKNINGLLQLNLFRFIVTFTIILTERKYMIYTNYATRMYIYN